MSKAIAYAFTINNDTPDDLLQVLSLNASYLVFGFEEGEQGTPHIQGYVHFHNQRHFNSVKKLLPRAHIYPAKGSAHQNRDYCSKEDDWYEFGTIPSQGKARWEKIEQAMQNPKENPHLYNQYRKAYKEIKSQEVTDLPTLVYLIPDDEWIEVAKRFHEDYGVLVDDLDLYDGEQIIVQNFVHDQRNIQMWINNIPTKIRRGYEIIRVKPRALFLTFSTNKSKNVLYKKYSDYIDKVCPTMEEVEEDLDAVGIMDSSETDDWGYPIINESHDIGLLGQ